MNYNENIDNMKQLNEIIQVQDKLIEEINNNYSCFAFIIIYKSMLLQIMGEVIEKYCFLWYYIGLN